MSTLNRINGTSQPDHVVAVIGEYQGVSLEVWDVSPDLAKRMLRRVFNRPLKVGVVQRYARTMAEGRWRMNFEWIGLDTLDYVIEGQHRLNAVVQSGQTVRFLVLRNLPREMFPSLGTAVVRGGADNLALTGVANAKAISAALTYLHRAENGLPIYTTGVGSRPDNEQVLSLNKRHGVGLEESLKRAMRCWRLYPSVAALTYLHYEFSLRDKALADDFCDKLADGENLRSSDPVFALRERLIVNKGSKAKLPLKYIMAMTIKAWNYAREGKRAPKYLRWSDGANESFPEIL